MPTIIGHSAVSLAIGQTVNKKINNKIIILCLLCGFVPDADFISFAHGIEYGSIFGHRGFSHSFIFASLFSFVITFGFFSKLKIKSRQFLTLFLMFFMITVSHDLLDMLTNGGYGIALLSPLSNARFFFPWRPIPVSPLGINNLFSPQSLHTMTFEMIFLVAPSMLHILLLRFFRKIKGKREIEIAK